MCGIAGYADVARVLNNEKNYIKTMAEQLRHRGPDAEGYWISDHAALGHSRLVVVDPEGGKQPMVRRRGESVFALVYNGELYNTEDIRSELTAKGYFFEGWSDTEVLLTSYMEWGEACLEKFNGIFAFAIWDGEKNRLFLARDRIGVKPLFYSQKGNTFFFASEIKALLAHPEIPPVVSREGLAEIFVMGPSRTPGHGVFSGISELKPGYCMCVGESGIKIRQYWSLQSHEHEENFGHTVNSVRDLVTDSITRQLVSDVPLCVLLSGGLDSSAISAVASGVYREERKDRLRTFSVDYVGNDTYFKVNEFQPNADAPWVEKVSDFLGTRHEICYIDTPELVEALFPSVLARDLPGMTDVDSSLLLFSRFIKERSTVGISGECADEVFGGYPWFYNPADAENTFPWSRRLKDRLNFYSPELMSLVKPEEYMARRYGEALDEVPRWSGDSPQEARMRALFYLNLTRWMPTLLDRKDRMSMATGLELRVPFCDHRLVEYVWNIPWEMKNYRNREKGLLRQALTGILPDDVLWRKKSPYPKTHNPAFLEAVRRLTLAMLDDPSSPILPFISGQAVKELALTARPDTNLPWFGQLMNAPQLMAYLLQVNYWLREYKIAIE
ncbi:Asparagine synthetase [glutamine-hydrolyzing] 3 [bioreactor metagenome]|uniref:Asparagine synthetase [glutamine-hydrolyzing] 3 n=1 Tax=bioreactor metagenome TaxID=1076179 RepID=A0A644W747_9ZZZZ